jgi:hypothetical protein
MAFNWWRFHPTYLTVSGDMLAVILGGWQVLLASAKHATGGGQHPTTNNYPA